jgi:hypothetical protein
MDSSQLVVDASIINGPRDIKVMVNNNINNPNILWAGDKVFNISVTYLIISYKYHKPAYEVQNKKPSFMGRVMVLFINIIL